MTIYQINGATRKELAMFFYSPCQESGTTGKACNHQEEAHFRAQRARPDDDGTRAVHAGQDQGTQELLGEWCLGVCPCQRHFRSNGARTRTEVRERKLDLWSEGATTRTLLRRRWRQRHQQPAACLAPCSFPLSAILKWCGWTADVATAFLQGLPQERQLWVKLPREVLTILGADDSTRMLLRKPCYGQIDAPWRWFLEATRRLTSIGLRPHILDPCAFLICETDFPDIAATDPSRCLGAKRIVGMVCVHVDDILGGGLEDSLVYQHVVKQLRTILNFREWKDQDELEYCGASLQKAHNGGWKVNHSEYLKKVKPIPLHRGRGPEDYMTPAKITQLRGLLGSLQWPSAQSQPHLQCSTSLLDGQLSAGLVKSIQGANRLLKFAKLNSDVSLCYEHLCELEDLRLVTMVDAKCAFGIRRVGSSQGGYLMMLVPKTTFDGVEGPYHD